MQFNFFEKFSYSLVQLKVTFVMHYLLDEIIHKINAHKHQQKRNNGMKNEDPTQLRGSLNFKELF